MASPPPTRLLVIKLADVGDALTITPALRALRATWPSATIDVLTSAVGRAALEGLDSLDDVHVADKHAFDTPLGALSPRAVLRLLPLLWRLRRRGYDQLLLAHHLTTFFGRLKYRLLVRLIGASRTIGLDNGQGDFLDVRVADHGFGVLHEVEYGLALASAAGASLQETTARLEIAVDDAAEQRAASLLGSVGTWIAFHAGGGLYSRARRWPAQKFAEVAIALEAETGCRVVLIGTEDDLDPHGELADLLGDNVLDLTGRTSLKETAAVLRRCRLLVSNDSGVIHLAAAVGTPVVAVFGPSNDLAWGPYPPGQHRVVRVTLPCSPCFYRGKSLGTPEGCATRDCLQLVTTDIVLASARELLAGTSRPKATKPRRPRTRRVAKATAPA